MSIEEKTTQDFIGYVHNLQLDEIKNMCTDDTKFYIKIFVEPIISLGDKEAINQIQKVVSTFACSGEDNKRRCTYFDENGKEQFFELVLVEGYDDDGEQKIYIDIDKKYFIGE